MAFIIDWTGKDIINGTDGDDFLLGLWGDDEIHGGDGNDIILGGSGDDSLYGEGGNDFIVGGSGNDLISGGSGSNLLLGGRGHDTFLLDVGNNLACGGTGNDTFKYPLQGHIDGSTCNFIKGGRGTDTFVFDLTGVSDPAAYEAAITSAYPGPRSLFDVAAALQTAGLAAPAKLKMVGVENLEFEIQYQISIDDVAASEAAGTASFTVSLNQAVLAGQTVTVDYATADDTANAGSDYTAIPTTTLTFNPGEQSKQVAVTIADDADVEVDEAFFVNLTNQSTNAAIVDAQGLGTISDNDAPSLPTGVIVVDWEAVGANDGTSWANAYNDLQDALAFASNPVNGVIQIWIAEGVYIPGTDVSTSNFNMIHGIDLYGGFKGDETSITERDPATHETILSGDNNLQLIVKLEAGVSANLDGFTISDAAIIGNGVWNEGTVELNNVHITSVQAAIINGFFAPSYVTFTNGKITNTISTAIFSNSGNLEFTNAEITNTPSVAINFSNGDLNITNGKITNNALGIGVINANLVITDSTFTENTDSTIDSSASNVRITNSYFVNNGKTANSTSPILIQNSTSAVIENSVFANNEANSAFNPAFSELNSGAIGVYQATLEVINSTFYNNNGSSASVSADAILANEGSITLDNGIFWGSTNQIATYSTGTVNVEYSDVEGGYTGTGNIDIDPLFVNPTDPLGDGLALQNGSPALDAGSDAAAAGIVTDITGGSRIVDAVVDATPGGDVDMGAYEMDVVGTSGADTLAGTAGVAEEIVAGAGDDTIVYDSADSVVDGGTGTDTLLVNDTALNLATTTVNLSGIEKIHLQATGAQTVTLSAPEVLALSNTTDELRITSTEGASTDAVVSTDTWTAGGTVLEGATTYNLFTSGSATLLVEDGIDIAGINV